MSPRTAAISPAVVALPAPTASTAPTGAYCGVVKSFNDQRGFGWLSCPAAGRDVFVHVNDLSRPEDRMLLPFAPNTVLQFDIAHRPRGLSAVNVTVVHAAAAAAAPAAAPVEAKEALAIRPRRPVASSASRAPLPDVSPDERFRGTIVYYAATKGFGFVQSASLPSKVYLHVYSVEKYGAHELEIGMSVEFSVRENAKGKYAGAIKVLQQNGDSFEEAPYGIEMWPGRHRGVLRSYDPKRTLGWVSCGNTEVLMHIYELRQHDAEERLVDGLVLEFSVGMHGRGATAYDIDIIEDAMPVSPVARIAPLTTTALVQEIVAAKSVHLRSPFAPVVPPSLKPILSSAATVTPSSAPLSHRSLVGTPYMPADLRSPISPAGSTAPPSPVRSPSPSTRSSSPLSLAENSGDEFGAIGDRRSPSSATSPLFSSSTASAANIFCDPANNLWDAFQKGLSTEQGSTVDAYWGSVFKAFVNPWSTL